MYTNLNSHQGPAHTANSGLSGSVSCSTRAAGYQACHRGDINDVALTGLKQVIDHVPGFINSNSQLSLDREVPAFVGERCEISKILFGAHLGYIGIVNHDIYLLNSPKGSFNFCCFC